MVTLLRSPTTAVWLVLVGLTLTSVWFGTDHGVTDVEITGVMVLVIAFIKVRFIGMYFMELRTAPIPLRALFDAWCFLACGAIVTMFMVL